MAIALLVCLVVFFTTLVIAKITIYRNDKDAGETSVPKREDSRYRLVISKPRDDSSSKPWHWQIEYNHPDMKEDAWKQAGVDAHGYINYRENGRSCGDAETEADARIAGENQIKILLERNARRKLTYTYEPDL